MITFLLASWKIITGLFTAAVEWFASLPASIKWGILGGAGLVIAGIYISNSAYDRGAEYEAKKAAQEIADIKTAVARQNDAIEQQRRDAEADRAAADKRASEALRAGEVAREKEAGRGSGADAMNSFFGGVFK